ncbi:MAG: choice-of-anchor D domain-containing protein, partial [Deltaproteobacteria bacterium]|nr:choice-of-anchor D domain-containing protein [Deltaproteobacteria bacterium]
MILGSSSIALASLTANPSPIAFGDVAVGASDTQSTTVSTDQALGDDLASFAITGTGCGAGVVTVTPTPPDNFRVILPVSPMSIDVTFTPVARGSLTCTVTFRDPNNASLGTLTVTGKGTAPEINAPATATFAARRVLDTATAPTTSNATIQIGSQGDSALNITAITISGTNAGDFSIITNPAPASVAINSSVNVVVRFNPGAAGARTAKLDIASNDPINPTTSVTLDGTGTAARIAVTDISFGIVNLGSSDTDTVSVTNAELTNPGPLRITAAAIVGGAGWFSFVAAGGCSGVACNFGTPGLLAPQTISVVCTPPAGASGTMTASVDFSSDTDGGGDVSGGLSCVAGRAEATLDPTSLNFGQIVEVGTTAQRTVSVRNDGNIDLVFTVTKATGARLGEYALSGCSTACTVIPGDTKTFTLSFTPTVRGDADITLSLAGDADGAIAIPVDAKSIAPVVVQPATVQFNSVEVL